MPETPILTPSIKENLLGTVISTIEGPTTSFFAFVINSSRVRKGQFVQTPTEDGALFGIVSEISRANRYFEHAESVAEYEKGFPMPQNFPTADWEYTIAQVRALGIYKGGNLIRNTFPAAPGSKVEAADERVLAEFLKFDEKGLNLGRLQNHNLDAKINMNRLLQKHLAILAMSGAGKSYLCGVLLEELLERKKEQGRIAVIVIDVHGEYIGFKQSAYGRQTQVFDANKVKIALRKLSPQMLFEWMPELSAPQKREIASVLKEMKMEAKDKQEAFGLKEFVQRIEASAKLKDNMKVPLISWISELGGMRIIGKVDTPKIGDVAKSGMLSVIDLSEIDSLKKKQILVSYIAKKLFLQRKKGKIPPFLLLVEEAHNFAREKAPKEAAISKHVIELIAREGRKFGASLCLVSQRPVQLSTTALSQCNSNIILRVTNPYDIDHIAESCEGIDSAAQNSITTLRVGEALVLGEAVSHPIFIKVRQRKSRHTTKGEDLEVLAQKFENAEEKKGEDVEAFI